MGLATPVSLELTISAVTGRRDDQLRYGAIQNALLTSTGALTSQAITFIPKWELYAVCL